MLDSRSFVATLSVIVVSELGDKTFFIAAIMAMTHARVTVFLAAISALIVMTLLSVFLGMTTAIIPKAVTHYVSVLLFLVFGLKMLWDAKSMSGDEAQEEYEEVQKSLSQKSDKKRNKRTSSLSSPTNGNITSVVGNGSIKSSSTLSNIPTTFSSSSPNNMEDHAISIDSRVTDGREETTDEEASDIEVAEEDPSSQLLNSVVTIDNMVKDPETGVIREHHYSSQQGKKLSSSSGMTTTFRPLSFGSQVKRKLMRFCSLVFLETFTMTFVAEWGDRSQITTIILAAREDPFSVSAGAIVGHAICSMIAVVAGRLVAQMISARTVTIIGGVIFVAFAFSALLMGE